MIKLAYSKGFKSRLNQKQSGTNTRTFSNAPTAAVDNTQLNTMDARVQALEVKIDKLMGHFGVK